MKITALSENGIIGIVIGVFEQYILPSIRVMVYDVKARNRILEEEVRLLKDRIKTLEKTKV